jgi:hypothetical protein
MFMVWVWLVALTVLLLEFLILEALSTHCLGRANTEFGHSILLPALVMALLQSLVLLAGQVVEVAIAADTAFALSAESVLAWHGHHVRVSHLYLLI